jgi:hypothetical protein
MSWIILWIVKWKGKAVRYEYVDLLLNVNILFGVYMFLASNEAGKYSYVVSK